VTDESAYWTLPQVLIWILIKDDDKIDEIGLIPPEEEADISVRIVNNWEEVRNADLCNCSHAYYIKRLTILLKKGKIRVMGFSASSPIAEQITPLAWRELFLTPEGASSHRSRQIEWTTLRFRTSDIVREMGMTAEPADPSANSIGILTELSHDRIAPAKAISAEGAVVPREQQKAPSLPPTKQEIARDAKYKNQIDTVLACARRIIKSDGEMSVRELARKVEFRGANEGYGFETIKKIISGTYDPQVRMGIPGISGVKD
jgi:hypothetical protein